MKEKNAPKSRKAARSAATIVRFRSAANGTRGWRDRDSTRTNVASSAAAPANTASVVADAHP